MSDICIQRFLFNDYKRFCIHLYSPDNGSIEENRNGHTIHFYRAAWNADAVSDEKLSVRLSVCLSVKRVDCDKTEERSVQIFILYKRSFSIAS